MAKDVVIRFRSEQYILEDDLSVRLSSFAPFELEVSFDVELDITNAIDFQFAEPGNEGMKCDEPIWMIGDLDIGVVGPDPVDVVCVAFGRHCDSLAVHGIAVVDVVVCG